MTTVGELLKKQRQDNNISLEEVSSHTKIQLSILRKIEENLMDQLPHRTIVRGFIRHYARFLKLNEDEVLQLFDGGHLPSALPVKGMTPEANINPAQNTIGNKQNLLWFRTSSTFVSLLGLAIIIALGSAIYFFSVKMISYSEETYKKSEEAPSVSATTQENVTNITSADTTNTSTESTPTVETQDKETKPTEQEKSTETSTAPETTQKTKKEETPKTSAAALTPIRFITVEAMDHVTVRAEWSTGKQETLELDAPRRHTFYYSQKIKLIIDNAGAVNLSTNKQKLGVPGEPGKEVQLSFN